MELGGWIAELRRRRVFRALVAWGVVAFAALQVFEPVQHGLHLPEWTLTALVWALGLGFPVAASLAWVFDLGAAGVTRTPAAPGATLSGPRAALLLLALGLLAAAPGALYYFAWPGAARRAPEPAAPQSSAEASPGTATTTGGAPAAPSIAVLPFADMSSAHDQEFMGDGLAEEILNLLAQVDGLQVTGRTSSFSFKGKTVRLEEIGRDLHVAHVLEGSVRRAGQRIRVTAQLVKTADGFHLWSQNFDRDLADALALQDEIARAVVAAIAPRLTGRAPAAARAGAAAPSPEAYAAYLAGKQGSRAPDAARVRQAQASLERAVELAPGFAPAHAALARTYDLLGGYFADTPEEVTRYASLELASAERAVALDPELGEAYAARALHALSYAWDWQRALADSQRAVELAPGSPEARSVHARALATVGRRDEALAEARRAVAADPLADWTWASLGLLAFRLGDRVAVGEALDRLAALSPTSALYLALRAGVLLQDGRTEEALAAYRLVPLEFIRALGSAICEHRLGHEAESREALGVLEGRLAGSAAYQAAEARAMRGEPDQAFDWLERARLQHDSGLTLARLDYYLTPLHGDPRWKPFLRKLGLPE